MWDRVCGSGITISQHKNMIGTRFPKSCVLLLGHPQQSRRRNSGLPTIEQTSVDPSVVSLDTRNQSKEKHNQHKQGNGIS
mmetsp:Transcript_9944/g.37087  ORF Transcript_9944/g.37087 Transcript_9944/m.37087 type:complete len:80 (-) Transcript_9944:1542-1781(-)